MTRRRLGRTELMAAPIAWGTVEIGIDYGIASTGERLRPDTAEAERLVCSALDLGVNVIDTARNYGDAEEIIGRALGSRRSEAVLVTKVSTFFGQEMAPAERRRRMIESVEQSVARLRADTIDLLLLHCAPLEESVPEETFEALAEAKARGLARHTGASTYGFRATSRALREDVCECLQIAASAIDRRLEADVVPAAIDKDCGLMIRSVLLRGALSARWRSLPDALGPVRVAAESLERIAGEAGVTLAELAYRYMVGQEWPLTVLCGTGRLEELQQSVRWAEAGPLPEDVAAAVRRVEISDCRLLDFNNWPAC